jgi:Tfp pilus assembly protein PilF
MNEEELIQQLVDGKTLSGPDAVAAFRMLKSEEWRFGVRVARAYLERGDTENAKAALDALLEEEPTAKGEEEE